MAQRIHLRHCGFVGQMVVSSRSLEDVTTAGDTALNIGYQGYCERRAAVIGGQPGRFELR